MNNYLIIGIIISIVCLFIFNSDLLRLDFLNYEIRRKTKAKKIVMNDSSVDYDSDSNITDDSKYKKNKKNLDETEISFDDSSDKSKIFNNKNTNNKLLNNIKKMMIDMKNKKKNTKNRESRDSRNSRESRESKNKKDNDIQEMHRLAEQLRNKNNQQKQQINQSDNTNYDLTDTISGIINNELNNA
jgi:hypothetical protein